LAYGYALHYGGSQHRQRIEIARIASQDFFSLLNCFLIATASIVGRRQDRQLGFGKDFAVIELEEADLGHHQMRQPRDIIQAQCLLGKFGCPLQ